MPTPIDPLDGIPILYEDDPPESESALLDEALRAADEREAQLIAERDTEAQARREAEARLLAAEEQLSLLRAELERLKNK